MNIEDLELVETSWICPEQYDVYYQDKQVGYLRLRGGWFRADCPGCGGETVYENYPNGDGRFDDDEREHYLTEAKEAIVKYHAGLTS